MVACLKKALPLVLALSLMACHTSLYTTPRTIPKGKVAHTVALEVPLIPIPTMRYGVRVGLADRVDLGFGMSSDFKLDVKFNIVRSRYFDMAIDPTLGGGIVSVGAHEGISLGAGAMIPLMMGFNLGERVTLLLHAGPLAALERSRFPGSTYLFSVVTGLGCQIRANEWLAIHPEASLFFFEPQIPYPQFGLGFVFGQQPKYDAAEK